MTNDDRTRRRFLRASAVASAAALAGCTGGSDDQDDETTEHHEKTTEHHEETTGHHEEGHHDDTTEQHGEGHHEETTGHHEEGHHEEGHHDETTGHHDGDHHGESSLGSPSASATVKMVSTESGNHFEPHVVHVEVGGTVTWHNESGSHSTTAYHPDNDAPRRVPEGTSAWDSGVYSESGATFERAFEEPGVYDYYCTPHGPVGMIGTVVVGDPGPSGQSGLQPPGDELSDAASAKIESLNERVRSALSE